MVLSFWNTFFAQFKKVNLHPSWSDKTFSVNKLTFCHQEKLTCVGKGKVTGNLTNFLSLLFWALYIVTKQTLRVQWVQRLKILKITLACLGVHVKYIKMVQWIIFNYCNHQTSCTIPVKFLSTSITRNITSNSGEKYFHVDSVNNITRNFKAKVFN